MARMTSNNNEGEEFDDGGNEEGRGEEGEAARNRMRKGPWTPNEDAILIEYVNKYGEGNWNSVQKNSGLSRCGKSCRLRWANHLRPNLKKGSFSDQEEKIIIQLHSKLGNKWAQMAAQLPGRTDNEIKNFWNTRLKRRQRAGLPIYPPQDQDKVTSYLQQQKQQHSDQPFSSSSPSFSKLLSSCYPKKLNERTHFSSLNPLQTQPDNNNNNNNNNPACYTNSGTGNRNANLVLPLSPYGSSSSSSTNFFFNQSLANSSIIPEISSSQSQPGSATPDSCYTSGVGGGLTGASGMVNEGYEVAPLYPKDNNSGLLDAVVIEAQGLSRCNEKQKSDEDSTFARKNLSYKRKSMALEEYGNNEERFTSLLLESSPKSTRDSTPETQTGKKVADEEALVEMNNCMDDDLFSLLNNFQSQTPTPEWYFRGNTNQSLGLETQAANSPAGPTDPEFAWTLGNGWMPGLC